MMKTQDHRPSRKPPWSSNSGCIRKFDVMEEAIGAALCAIQPKAECGWFFMNVPHVLQTSVGGCACGGDNYTKGPSNLENELEMSRICFQWPFRRKAPIGNFVAKPRRTHYTNPLQLSSGFLSFSNSNYPEILGPFLIPPWNSRWNPRWKNRRRSKRQLNKFLTTVNGPPLVSFFELDT